MKKEKQKEIATLDWQLSPEGLTLTINGEAAAIMPKQKLLELFDGLSIKAYYQNVESNETWGGLDNLSNFALAQRLLKKGLSSTEAAKFMGMEGERFRQLYSRCLQLYQRDVQTVNDLKNKSESEDFCKDTRADWVDPVTGCNLGFTRTFINLRYVKNSLGQGLKPKQIAEELHADADEFEKFLVANEPYLAVMA